MIKDIQKCKTKQRKTHTAFTKTMMHCFHQETISGCVDFNTAATTNINVAINGVDEITAGTTVELIL